MAKDREAKTKPTAVGVEDFLAGVGPPARREDAQALCALIARLSGEPAVMWGPSIVGFGSRHFRYDSGREGDILRIGFSPRKAALVLYVLGEEDMGSALLSQLGKYTTGKACLYVKRLADIDLGVLEALIAGALKRSLARDSG